MARKHVISSARDFAAAAHGSQENAGEPLLAHLDEVAVLVRAYGELHQTVAYLHHIIEDSDVPLEEIRQSFGQEVADYVGLLAGPPNPDPVERRRLTYAGLAKISPEDPQAVALIVKVADRLANVQDCFIKEDRGRMRKYRRDHRDFRAAVYRPGLAVPLWDELTELIAW
jgi:(p)ppGpp synthase/HD superfamily hydrolase